MRRKNLVKRFGIASLCLATAISAFSGIASFETDVAAAESTTLQATELVTASEGATVTQSTVDAPTGLLISSDAPYEATFNEVFYKNSYFAFRFPETYDSTIGWYGDFKLRVSDVTDENNYFDLIWYVSRNSSTTSKQWTGLIMQYKDQIRTCSTATTGTTWYNYKPTGIEETDTAKSFLPHFQSRGSRTTRFNKLTFTWNASGVLTIKTHSASHSTAGKAAMYTLAAFDGTYDATATKNGFVNKTSWGLPKLSFPNGYKVTVSSYMDTELAEGRSATDVLFHSFSNNCTMSDAATVGSGTTHALTTTTEFTNQYIDAYAALKANMQKGDVLLGWKDAENALYPSSTVYAATDISGYTPVVLGFDTINGASVRIDTAGGKSGIRFMALFDKAEYRAAKAYIQSFGTLLSYTDDLDLRDFTIANYQTEIDAQSTSIRQVANTTNTFNYDLATGLIGASGQPAYSIAVVDIEDYTKEYSVRGYIEVKYADETTQIIYTDYNEADNSRSIAEVAYKIKTNAAAEYENYEQAYKDVIDAYAEAYVAP